MHIHRLGIIWLILGLIVLFIFLRVLGVSAVSMGFSPPSANHHMIDPRKVNETAPFNHPGIKQVGAHEYAAVMVALAYGYNPEKMEVSVGSTVWFTVTSSDVVHGFAIPETNVNNMIAPGEVSQISHKFTKPGVYPILCKEYSWGGHENMQATIEVK
jgi:cytochrome c oxidase subunit II